jgi:hypothetical protein
VKTLIQRIDADRRCDASVLLSPCTIRSQRWVQPSCAGRIERFDRQCAAERHLGIGEPG